MRRTFSENESKNDDKLILKAGNFKEFLSKDLRWKTTFSRNDFLDNNPNYKESFTFLSC